MLRFIYCLIIVVVANPLWAQFSPQTIELRGATSLKIEAHLSAVELLPSDATTIELLHEFYINGEAQPEDCELTIDRQGDQIIVQERGPDTDRLQNSWSRYDDDSGSSHHQNVEIKLTIKVPAGLEIIVETLYGSVKADDVGGLREVDATYGEIELRYENVLPPAAGLKLDSEYGAIDLSLPGNTNAEVQLETNYGNLLTDFDIQIDRTRSDEGDFHQEVVGTIGRGGQRVSCRSPYSNVYLRQTK